MTRPLLARAVVRLAARSAAPTLAGRVARALLGLTLRSALRRAPLPELLAALDGDAAGGPHAAPPELVGRLRRWRTTCLYRALAGYASLRARGVPVRFVIGVRRGEQLVAHAWLEVDDRPVAEGSDPRAEFAVAFTHPPRGPRAPQEVSLTALRADPDVILTELQDGTGVLLHLGTKFYYALNRTGVVAWKLLAAGAAHDAAGLALRLAERFAGVTPEQARGDVEALLAELRAEGLLRTGEPG